MKKYLLLSFLIALVNFSFAQTNIYNIQGQTDVSPYNNQTVTTSGIVTGIFSKGYFIQDGIGAWNGIYIYDQTNKPNLGDELTIAGTVSEYYNFTEIKSITNYTVKSTGNKLPDPVIVSTGEMQEKYESVLIQVKAAKCTNQNLGYGEWELNDGSGKCIIDDMGIPYTPIEGISYNVTGILNFSYGNFMMEPRDNNDIEMIESLHITQGPTQTNLLKTGFTITWETNDTSSTEIKYGLTSDLELGSITGENNVKNHTINFTGLSPATIYYMKIFSVSGTDTTPTSTKLFSTVSNSSGNIKVYFNHSVDTTVSSGTNATYTPSISDTVISYLNKAQKTIDITMYDIDNENIVSAINEAYNKGVKIRFITDSLIDSIENPILSELNQGIPLVRGNIDGIMHDKFIIIDADEINNSWVMTGSTNYNEANLVKDYNNMICIQDQSLAKAFQLEFNEMWGSDNNIPNKNNEKFGSEKTDNTPHQFLINDIPIECYFSPSDNTTSKIANAINSADDNLEFGVLVFTENSLGTAVLKAHNRGVNVKGIIDYVEYTGNEYDNLVANGVQVLDYENPDGSQWPEGATFHHKYAIIDQNNTSSDPTLITGSHNWSASAESRNDENTLIIHDATITNLYYQEFTQRFNELLTPVLKDDSSTTTVNTSISIDVLANDFIHKQVTSTTMSIENIMHGTAKITNDTIVYTPNNNFTGIDTITYKVTNDDYPKLFDVSNCIINVTSVMTITAYDDTASMAVKRDATDSLIINILNNDNYLQNDFIIKITKQASNGVAEINKDNTLTYTPNINFEGIDTVIYKLCNADSSICDEANVIINVSISSGINQITNSKLLSIYPNPNLGKFDIKIDLTKPQKIKIQILNLSGKIIYDGNKTSNAGINIIHLSKIGLSRGVYILKLSTNKYIINKKIIIN